MVQAQRPNRQQERTEKSTEALLDATAALIVEGGLSSVTFATIGDRAGYSRGLVTARFGSKDGLIEAMMDRIVGRWGDEILPAGIDAATAAERLDLMLGTIRDHLAVNPHGLRVLYACLLEAGSDETMRRRFVAFHTEMRAAIAATVRDGHGDGSIRADLDPDQEAIVLVAGIRGIGIQWHLDHDAVDPVAAMSHLIDSARSRLAPVG